MSDFEPIYTTCKLCGVIVMADTPPQCGDGDCPYIDEWADPPLTDSQKAQNYEQMYGHDYLNMGEPHPDSDEYEEDQ